MTLGSRAADTIHPPCGSDYTLQADGTRRRDMKAVRAAVDEFAKAHGRQVQLAYRDPQRAFMWNAVRIPGNAMRSLFADGNRLRISLPSCDPLPVPPWPLTPTTIAF